MVQAGIRLRALGQGFLKSAIPLRDSLFFGRRLGLPVPSSPGEFKAFGVRQGRSFVFSGRLGFKTLAIKAFCYAFQIGVRASAASASRTAGRA
jgi:hypothetical protein